MLPLVPRPGVRKLVLDSRANSFWLASSGDCGRTGEGLTSEIVYLGDAEGLVQSGPGDGESSAKKSRTDKGLESERETPQFFLLSSRAFLLFSATSAWKSATILTYLRASRLSLKHLLHQPQPAGFVERLLKAHNMGDVIICCLVIQIGSTFCPAGWLPEHLSHLQSCRRIITPTLL